MDREVSQYVLQLNERVSASYPEGLIETVPTFHSLLLRYNPLVVDFDEMETWVKSILVSVESGEQTGQLWHLPVCYEADCAPDLGDVAERLNLSPAKVIDLHCERTHHIYMVGFLAGCPYLGDLPEELSLPRRSDPRLKVPSRSIAIAVTMTVIYPVESPGGWHLIGKTPFSIFNANWSRPALFKPGDQVEFQPVSLAEFEKLQNAIAHEGHSLLPVSA